MRPSARKIAVQVKLHERTRAVLSHYDSHQSGFIRTLPTTDARANHRRQV